MPFSKISKKLGDIAQNTVKKTGELYDTTKLNLEIKKEEDSIRDLYMEIGKYCFECCEAGKEFDSYIMELCGKITGHINNIDSLKKKIEEIKNQDL